MLDPNHPVFPPEIFDHIIDLSADDRTVLAATSLVCLDWVPASRRHLFHTITFRPSTLKDFQSLCSGPNRPTFLHHICHIKFANDKVRVDENTSDNSRPTPLESIKLNQDLLSWFPTLPSVFFITFDAIGWESQEILSRFGSLIPCAKGSKGLSIRTGRYTSHQIEYANQLLQAFPLLERLFFAGGAPLPRTLQKINSLAKPASDRLSVLRLKSLFLVMNEVSRDEFIRTVPLGSVQLDRFKFQLSSDENPTRLHNLILFLRQHCLNVSFLHINIYQKRIRHHSQERKDTYDILVSEFIHLFSKFHNLSTLEILVKCEFDYPQLPEWVYPALDAIPSRINIKNLRFLFWDPVYLGSCVTPRPRDAEQWEYFDWSVLKHVLSQEKFISLVVPVVLYGPFAGQAPELFVLPSLIQ